MISCMPHSTTQHSAVTMHHLALALQHPAVTSHHAARTLQHQAAVLPLSAGNLHGKQSPAGCTPVVCAAKHPAAPFTIGTVQMAVISTLITLSLCMSNNTMHETAMCSSCCLVYHNLNEPVCSYLSKTCVVHILIHYF